RFFTLFSYTTAFSVFLACKLGAVAALLWLWRTRFLDEGRSGLFFLFCLFAFNGALFIDLYNGNIAVFEQLLLWTAFGFLLNGRSALFCVFVLIAASCKITPLFFLALLLFAGDPKGKIYLAVSLGLFAGFHLSTFLAMRVEPAGFLQNAFFAMGSAGEGGVINPSILSLVRELLRMFSCGYPFAQALLFAAAVSAVLWISCRAFARCAFAGRDDRLRFAVLFACVVYALVVPRMKDYSYVILIVPAFVIFWRCDGIGSAVPLIAMSSFCTRPDTLPLLNAGFMVAWKYYPLALAFVVWGLYLRCLRQDKRAAGRPHIGA
ncbi:MAG TPA: glycosyltransferase family 87 protein, partial [bacterium]|nr:glycosyltransferase family 87 protein [bacterium]